MAELQILLALLLEVLLLNGARPQAQSIVPTTNTSTVEVRTRTPTKSTTVPKQPIVGAPIALTSSTSPPINRRRATTAVPISEASANTYDGIFEGLSSTQVAPSPPPQIEQELYNLDHIFEHSSERKASLSPIAEQVPPTPPRNHQWHISLYHQMENKAIKEREEAAQEPKAVLPRTLLSHSTRNNGPLTSAGQGAYNDDGLYGKPIP
ncbi:hypothetical protein NHQ30_008084 [Ciborinia camelliae]|nr:hypothetical protein NHQ30_008084 [Ciborinia camelliae]